MKMPLRRRYALAFLTLAVFVIAVFTLIMTAQIARQHEAVKGASLRAMSTALDLLANDRARLVAELTAGALADAVLSGDPEIIADHAENLRSRQTFAFLRVIDATGAPIYAEGEEPVDPAGLGGNSLRLSLAGGDSHVWERAGVMNASAAVQGQQGVVGAVHIGLPLQPLSASLAPVEAELAKTVNQENTEHLVHMLIGAAVILLASLLIALWNARDLSAPIEQLSRLTARYGRGDYDAEVPVHREDEIGELADSLRRMARNLKETTVSRDQLERTIEDALRANRSKSDFIALMSHELREENVDLAMLIDSTLRLFADRAARHNLRLQADLASDLPLLAADRLMMRQILNNLLSNAVKFTLEGGAITVRAGRTGESLWIAVQDSGIGMAPADIPKALTPYMQIDSAQNREHRGTGLGLPLVKALVELHGGSLMIDSAPGVGTTITLFFPQARIVAPADSGQSSLPLWQGAAG